jgi:hypothetical protein
MRPETPGVTTPGSSAYTLLRWILDGVGAHRLRSSGLAPFPRSASFPSSPVATPFSASAITGWPTEVKQSTGVQRATLGH